MAYQKTTWIDNETVVDAEKLNKIENKLAELDGIVGRGVSAIEVISRCTTEVRDPVAVSCFGTLEQKQEDLVVVDLTEVNFEEI